MMTVGASVPVAQDSDPILMTINDLGDESQSFDVAYLRRPVVALRVHLPEGEIPGVDSSKDAILIYFFYPHL